MRIMLIDDDKDSLLSLAEAIAPAGHTCDIYTAPLKAMDGYRGGFYDVVITDVRMPGISGLEVLARVTSVDPLARVILMTGYASAETSRQARVLGAYEFIDKPVNLGHLLATLDRLGRENTIKKHHPAISH